MKLFLNLSKVWTFSKTINVKQKKIKLFCSFIFINFVIVADLLIISILNFLFTKDSTSNQYISFLFDDYAAFYLIGLIIVRFSFLYSDHILREKLRFEVDKELKFRSITKLLDNTNKEVSDIAYEVNNEATMLGLLYRNLVSFFTNSFQFVSFMMYIIYLDFSITAFLLVIGSLSSFFIFIQKKKNKKTSENFQESLENINQESVDIASNYFLIKILKIEKLVKDNFDNTLDIFSNNFLKISNLRFVNYNTPQFIGTLSIALLIYLFDNTFSLEIIFLTLRMAQAFGASNESYHELSVKIPFLEKFLNRSVLHSGTFNSDYIVNRDLNSCVVAKKVSFKYFGMEHFIFNDLSFEIPKNSHSVILGKNGTGKSTLVGVISGVLTPSSGLIEVSSDNLGYVGNKPYIFNASLIDNVQITKALRKIDKKNIDSLFRSLSFYENFQSNYLNNKVTKDTLSDGQMQKLAFIRLILQSPEIIFLDEAFSNLDNESTNRIKNLIFGKSTIINITHNPDNFDNIDYKFVIENGKFNFQQR
jgi:ABC-type transport system involved in cytochrome bd biosynthesis fused ATPase/permease subunit|tara:strand:- start:1361 stop:2956 length:1596 start_codon:yes stop_codon:yes gene_type:complete